MNRLTEKIYQLKKANKKALICFVTAGFPNLKTTEKIISILETCGTDIIELGVPFSDPIADGPIIQHTSFQALKNKISLKKVLRFVKKVRLKSQIPIVILSYLNPIYNYGLERFFKYAKNCGIDGLIVPDIIPEEAEIIENLSSEYQLPIIYLLSTTTDKERRKLIFNKSSEFVYVVSVTGVTGPRKKFTITTIEFLKQIRKETTKPLMLGFGISSTSQIDNLKEYIDGIIIGSALLKLVDTSNLSELTKRIRNFLIPFRQIFD